ncbi:hypothetical protein [Niallia oryzisoli]|uniref:hypothetical protein n=1 Tax=Niallia oryzisoli TaxID=1737571 RepID=UPI0037363A36
MAKEEEKKQKHIKKRKNKHSQKRVKGQHPKKHNKKCRCGKKKKKSGMSEEK